jgi:hypothetical protein
MIIRQQNQYGEFFPAPTSQKHYGGGIRVHVNTVLGGSGRATNPPPSESAGAAESFVRLGFAKRQVPAAQAVRVAAQLCPPPSASPGASVKNSVKMRLRHLCRPEKAYIVLRCSKN